MIYAYLRVSTENQTLENQRSVIEQHYHIDKFFEEKKSGTIDYKDRSLNTLIKQAKKGDTIICSEISRLGRSLYMIMEILNKLSKKGVTLKTIKENFVLDNSINSKVISFAFGLCAEIERNLISQRTKEALALRREQGVILGRPFGATNKVYKLDRFKDNIIKYRENNKSVYFMSKRFRCSPTTVKSYLLRLNTVSCV